MAFSANCVVLVVSTYILATAYKAIDSFLASMLIFKFWALAPVREARAISRQDILFFMILF
jgi:hypothetical protein